MTGAGGGTDAARLRHALARRIRQTGPLTVAEYMQEALQHPRYGYYRCRDPFGRGGDFVTAPEISQMFGELLGLWAADWWARAGRPPGIALVELGPGRGTLMVDALRAARVLPAFHQAVSVHLVESSPRLRDRQRAALAGTGVPLTWHDTVAELPVDRPLIVFANEFFDALPIRQFVRTDTGWAERVVALGADGETLAFGLSPVGTAAVAGLRGQDETALPAGSLVEACPAGTAIMDMLAARIAAAGGGALIIDYGHVGPAAGDTLQAVAGHRPVDPLARPGEADLTAHVDFTTLGRVARDRGLRVQGPVEQGPFLSALGLQARTERLKTRADAVQQRDIDAAAARLTDPRPTGMGCLFKVLAVTEAGGPAAAGMPA